VSNQRVIVVTGGSRGIGRAIALRLASPESLIYVTFRNQEAEANQVVSEIAKNGGHAKAIAFDVASPESVESGFEKIAEESGGVDVLVSNAGIAIDGLLPRFKNEDIEKLTRTNLEGSIVATRSALKTMLRRKSNGRIVYVTSVVGQMGNAGQSIYAATKSGLRGFMKSMAREVASRGITVNAVAPGFVKTDMTEHLTDAQKNEMLKRIPLGRYAAPEDVANVVEFLVSERASYITGQEIAVNGGMFL
jgi:3-oxoacyl-[acyl-carrier protein] reductase